ncbi:hypothetical protein F5876DRAFT_65209 [Lentinula aff. lateritia]|uniref:Uncharacterized protein n=1 Tax=Lentinula aff. lateritia TaxID=2804960 RepID=A0ACC1U268_9AGAR|nr:hypothetical protein F5876DRAFT_65209 [Lentinula aff. lateritia]
MHYFQLGGFRESRHRWDNPFRIRNEGGSYNDQKIIAGKVFEALTVSTSNANVAKGEFKYQPNFQSHYYEEMMEEEIKLTLGILPSGASLLLLTFAQVKQLCSYWRYSLPLPKEALQSSVFESLSPIEFDDIDSLAAKLRSLAPKSRGDRRDTSRDNKAFCQFVDLQEGSKRGVFENVRLLRQLATKRIPPPPSTPGLGNTIHEPYAQFSVPQNLDKTLLPRIQVAAFAYTLWFAGRSNLDLLDVAWARAEGGMHDLRASRDSDTGGEQVDFGWNAYKNQSGSIKKTFPRSRVQAQKDPDFGLWLFRKLLGSEMSNYASSSTDFSSFIPDGMSASMPSHVAHLILLVYDEVTTRAVFSNLGIDVACADNSNQNNEGESGTQRWRWIKDAGLRDLLRDDSYGNLDPTRDATHTHNRPFPSSSASSLYSSRSSNPFSSSSTTTSFATSPDSYHRRQPHNDHVYNHDSDFDDQRGYRSMPSRARERHSDYNNPNHRWHGKREFKSERGDDEHRQFKRPKRGLRKDRHRGDRFDEDGYDTTSGEEDIITSESNERPIAKKEENDFRIKGEPRESAANATKRGDSSSSSCSVSKQEPSCEPKSNQQTSQQSQPPILQIHVIDLKTLFYSSTGSHTGADSVQGMARELNLGGGGIPLYGMLGKGEYGSGWDAELMLSIFQFFVDGRTINEQKATASSRMEVEKEERIERQKRAEAERMQNQSTQAGLDDDIDPNEVRPPAEGQNCDSELGEAWEDWGESD